MRLTWVDYLKVFGITLVVLGHFASPLRAWIFTFHMPLWFMISGFLYKPRTGAEELVKVWRSLLIPYWVYGVICIGLVCLLDGTGHGTLWIQWLVGDEDSMTSRIPKPLWFLLGLAGVRLLASISGKYRYLMVLPAVLFCIGIRYGQEHYPGFWQHDWLQFHSMLFAYPFFLAGMLLRHSPLLQQSGLQGNWRVILTCVVLGLCSFVLGHRYGSLDMSRCLCYGNATIALTCALVTSVCLFFLFAALPLKRLSWVDRLSQGTLLILSTHMIGVVVLSDIFAQGLKMAIAGTVAIMLLSYLLIVLSSRYCRILLGK